MYDLVVVCWPLGAALLHALSTPTATANNNSNKRTAAITNSNVNTTIFGNTITEL